MFLRKLSSLFRHIKNFSNLWYFYCHLSNTLFILRNIMYQNWVLFVKKNKVVDPNYVWHKFCVLLLFLSWIFYSNKKGRVEKTRKKIRMMDIFFCKNNTRLSIKTLLRFCGHIMEFTPPGEKFYNIKNGRRDVYKVLCHSLQIS